MIRILLADDDALILESLNILIELQEDLKVLGQCKNGQEVLAFLEKETVDVILLDIRMPVLDGVQTTIEVKKRFPHCKIVLLTTFKEEEYIKEALKNGADGYLLKSQKSETIIESIRSVYQGNAVYQKDVLDTMTLFFKESKKKEVDPIIETLTIREREVLEGIGLGLSNREISEKLYLGEGTVRNYVTNLLEKLSMRDRTQLAIYYHEKIKN